MFILDRSHARYSNTYIRIRTKRQKNSNNNLQTANIRFVLVNYTILLFITLRFDFNQRTSDRGDYEGCTSAHYGGKTPGGTTGRRLQERRKEESDRPGDAQVGIGRCI